MADPTGDLTAICCGTIILLIVLIIIGILVRMSRVAANVGTYRTGKAMKRISKQGLTINQQSPPQYYQQPYASQMQQPVYYPPQQQIPMFCPKCGKPSEGNAFCKYCGAKIY